MRIQSNELRFQDLTQESDGAVELQIDDGPLPVDCLVNVRPHLTHAPVCVVLNGAVDRTRSEVPVFQRSTWADEIEAHTIFVADPTLGIASDLSLGWGIGTLQEHGINTMSRAVLAIRDLICANFQSSKRTLYFGSSAGGFQALCLAALDEESSALAINPQIRVTDYFEDAVASAIWSGLGTASISNALQLFPERLDVFEFWRKVGRTPRCKLLVNSLSKEDIRRDVLRVFQQLTIQPTLESPFEVSFYSDALLGHNPPNKSNTLSIINNGLKTLL